jgi:uncharacterized protein YybS (DUF2232 family)
MAFLLNRSVICLGSTFALPLLIEIGFIDMSNLALQYTSQSMNLAFRTSITSEHNVVVSLVT